MNPTLIVLKFGSSVLANRDSLPAVVHEIYRCYRRGQYVLVVVSAIGRHTELLLDEARYWKDPPAPDTAVAELLATGEQQSAALLTMALDRAGVDATLLDPSDIKLTLRGDRLDASPVSIEVKAIRQAFLTRQVLVVPGFAGAHEAGGRSLMGRGGSDLTAVFLARALDAAQCYLVKDVDGIYESDPAPKAAARRTEERPHRYREMTYEDALRVSGPLVQPKAIEYLREHRTTARVAGLLQIDGTDIGTPASRIYDRPPSTPLKVLLMGLGEVGHGVCHHLRILSAFFEITGIQVRDANRSREFQAPEALVTTDVDELLRRPYEVVVDVCGDPSVARTVIEASLTTGRPAVTASKRLVAEWGPELARLAAKNGTRFYYSAAVGGAAPMIETLERALQHGTVTLLRGVLNGTCNFVLDRLAAGTPFHTAVSEARLRGFAESNVSRDLHGDDSADKLRILARLAFGAESDAVPISRQGLSPAEMGRLSISALNGDIVRQVATFDRVNGGSVQLQTLPADDYLAGACGEENRLVISGADSCEWRVSGKGAGRWPTAEAVIADLVDIHARVAAKAATAAQQSSTAPQPGQAANGATCVALHASDPESSQTQTVADPVPVLQPVCNA
jgi:homoserine dehydrogenase